MRGGEDGAGARGFGQDRGTGTTGEGGVGLVGVADRGIGELDGVHQEVPGDQQSTARPLDEQGLVARGVPRGSQQGQPAARGAGQPAPAVGLAEQARAPQRGHDVAEGRPLLGEPGGLRPLDHVVGVREDGSPVGRDRPAVVILVEVAEHDGVHLPGADARGRECAREAPRDRCPAGGRTVDRSDAGVEEGEPPSGAPNEVAAEVELPGAFGAERRRVEQPCAVPGVRVGVGKGGPGADRKGSVGVQECPYPVTAQAPFGRPTAGDGRGRGMRRTRRSGPCGEAASGDGGSHGRAQDAAPGRVGGVVTRRHRRLLPGPGARWSRADAPPPYGAPTRVPCSGR